MAFKRFALARLTAGEVELSPDLYRLNGYGDGLFVPLTDVSGASETYRAERYARDTIKAADLGREGGLLVLDFNFAYQPSCSYDPTGAVRSRRPQPTSSPRASRRALRKHLTGRALSWAGNYASQKGGVAVESD